MKLLENKKVFLSVLGMSGAALMAVSRMGGAQMKFNPYGQDKSISSFFRGSADVDSGSRALQAYNQGDNAITIPPFYNNIANIWDPRTVKDTPFFWYIPKAGGSTWSRIYSQCLKKVSCSAMGVEEPATYLTTNIHDDGGKYLNMNPGTLAGLDRMAQFNVIPSRHDDFMLITQHLYEGANLMSSTNQGRLFTMLRHPTKRVIDQFYYRQHAVWEDTFDPQLASMSIGEYAYSDRWVTNFMVRALNNYVTEDITEEHIRIAEEVLRRKFIVGIMEWYDKSVARFENYFGWWQEFDIMTNSTMNDCHYETIRDGDHIGQHPKVDATISGVIAFRNWADIRLYQYAKALFEEQEALVPTLG